MAKAAADKPSDDQTVTQAEQPPPDQSAEIYRRLEIGMTLHWYQFGTKADAPFACRITAVYPSSISVRIHDPRHQRYTRPNIDGLKWINDPALDSFSREQNGAFELPAFMRRLLSV